MIKQWLLFYYVLASQASGHDQNVFAYAASFQKNETLMLFWAIGFLNFV